MTSRPAVSRALHTRSMGAQTLLSPPGDRGAALGQGGGQAGGFGPLQKTCSTRMGALQGGVGEGSSPAVVGHCICPLPLLISPHSTL